MAGVSRLQYPSEIRLIRVMCSGRVDLEFILRAFATGQDGVIIGGCRLGECNYTTQGNYDALGNVLLCKKILERIGINPERLKIQFMSSGDGMLLAEYITEFSEEIKELGPLGESEGTDPEVLEAGLTAARKLVPYIRLVERERLRVINKSDMEYRNFYSSSEFERLFEELIADKLAMSRIAMLLGKAPLATGDIARNLGLNPSEASRHISNSSRQGLIRYDESSKSYMLA